uniref:Uncharacterized protein n=1 Tax=Tanacetum cinerariifolium TaxID=118510 RepID=A0A6L2LI94_TANCI|nr:hypothetical protein [Tanacetum cinerariifolium]
MLQICPRIPNQPFDELPFEEEILAFLRELGHSEEIKMITDVNINKLHQPWRPFAAVINKCLSGAEPPKTKSSVRKKQSSSDTIVPPPTTKDKRLKTSAKVDKPVKEKQPAKSSNAKGLIVLSEVAITKAEHMKLATKKSLTQTHISHASGSGVDEGTGIIPGVLDVPTYEYDDEEISWKLSEDDDDEVKKSEHDDDVDDQSYDDDDDQNDDDDNEQTDSNNDGDNFIHPKFSTHDDEDKEEESFDPIVQTPSHDENTDDEDNDKDSYGMNIGGDKIDNEGANKEDEANKLYIDVNIILEYDKDKDEKPFVGSNWGSKKRRAGKEPELTSAPKEKTSKTFGKSTEGSKSHCKSASEFAPAEEPMHTTQDLEEPIPQEFKTAFVMNRFKVDTLTPELLAGPTYELMKGSCKSLVELEFFLKEVYKATTNPIDWHNPEGQQYLHDLLKPLPLIPSSWGRRVIHFNNFINNDLEYLRGDVSSKKYTTSVTKSKAADNGHIKWIKVLFYGFAFNRESAQDVYSKRRIIAVTELQIVKWHNHKHLDWITILRDDNKLYKFKEGYFKRLRIQDIEDMLLLLVQGKLTNLTVDERFAFNVSL